MNIKLHYAERHFTLNEDNLNEQMLKICESDKELKNVPINISLIDKYILGVIGNECDSKNLVKSMIIQLASLYSFEEVKMIFIYDKETESEFDFVRWLPHTWDDEKNYRFVATNDKELKDIASYFESIISYRSDVNENEVKEQLPYYVLFVLNRELGIRSELVKALCKRKNNINFSSVFCYEKLSQLPKECQTVIDLSGGNGNIFDKDDITGRNQMVALDEPITTDMREIAVSLANVFLDNQNASYKLPNTVTFLEMFDVGKVEHLNIMSKWFENDPTTSLETPVGVDNLGGLFKLDLHEKFHYQAQQQAIIDGLR